MRILNQGIPVPFASIASAREWIERYEVHALYPEVRITWVGFECDDRTGGYFLSINPAGNVYIASERETTDDVLSELTRCNGFWYLDVERRTLAENNDILDWVLAADDRKPLWTLEGSAFLRKLTRSLIENGGEGQ